MRAPGTARLLRRALGIPAGQRGGPRDELRKNRFYGTYRTHLAVFHFVMPIGRGGNTLWRDIDCRGAFPGRAGSRVTNGQGKKRHARKQ